MKALAKAFKRGELRGIQVWRFAVGIGGLLRTYPPTNWFDIRTYLYFHPGPNFVQLRILWFYAGFVWGGDTKPKLGFISKTNG